MSQLLGVADGALQQGLTFGIGATGVALSLRSLRFPDLTSDGSFLLGATAFGATVTSGLAWPFALGVALIAGAGAGITTAAIHHVAGVNRLLSGILTSMICYSVGFWFLSGRPNIGIENRATPYTAAERLDATASWAGGDLHLAQLGVSALFVAAVVAGLWVLLGSQWGLVLRATGQDESLVTSLGRAPSRYRTMGLTIANGLVGLAGGLVAARQGFADVNMGPGSIVIFIASLVLGEELVRRVLPLRQDSVPARLLAPLAGCIAYYGIFLGILRASIAGLLPVGIRPTDLRLISAILIVSVVFWRSRRSQDGAADALPL